MKEWEQLVDLRTRIYKAGGTNISIEKVSGSCSKLRTCVGDVLGLNRKILILKWVSLNYVKKKQGIT